MKLDENKNINSAKPYFDPKSCIDAIVAYMTKPNFVNSDFIFQVTNTKSRLEFFHIDEKKLYLSQPLIGFNQNKVISSLSINPKSVEFGVLNLTFRA